MQQRSSLKQRKKKSSKRNHQNPPKRQGVYDEPRQQPSMRQYRAYVNASTAQRRKIDKEMEQGLTCIVDGEEGGFCNPAHIAPRTFIGPNHANGCEGDCALCTLRLSNPPHNKYDDPVPGQIMLLAYLLSEEFLLKRRKRADGSPRPRRPRRSSPEWGFYLTDRRQEAVEELKRKPPRNLDALLAIIDPEHHAEIYHAYEHLEEEVKPGKWPFSRLRIEDLPYPWIRKNHRNVSPYTVLYTILTIGSGVLEKRYTGHWVDPEEEDDYEARYFRGGEGANMGKPYPDDVLLRIGSPEAIARLRPDGP